MKKANKKKKKKNINTYVLPDIPWLDDDCDDARYQMDLIWMQMNPQSDDSENEVNTLKKININEDDLPF